MDLLTNIPDTCTCIMQTCNGIKSNGTRCTNATREGQTRCGVRHARYLDSPQCIGILPQDRGRCLDQAQDDRTMCRRCRNRNQIILEPPPPVQEEGELVNFVKDPQNVHTQLAVKNTLNAVDKILSLGSPYKHATKAVCMNLILECPLTVRALCDFTVRYWNFEADIYDIGPGIYFKLVNAIWHYTTQSPHKEDICKIIANELDDSVGMCAQGALSRLCNILAGYVEGIGEQRSNSEILGDVMPSIANNSNLSLYQKLNQARAILEELKIPQEYWDIWFGPLVNEGEDDYFVAWKLAHEL